MGAIIPGIIWVAIIVYFIKKAGKKVEQHARSAESAQSAFKPGQPGPASLRGQAAYSRAYSGVTRPTVANGRVFVSQEFDSKRYHSEGYDFDSCFSFKGIPDGKDELSYLIRWNTAHEKELEKLLQTSERD